MPPYIKKITSIIVILAFLATPEWSLFASDASGSRSIAQKVRYIREQAGLCPDTAYALRKTQTQEANKDEALAIGKALGVSAIASADGEDEQIGQEPDKDSSASKPQMKLKGWHLVLLWAGSIGWIFVYGQHLRQLGLLGNIDFGLLFLVAIIAILTWYYFGGIHLPDRAKPSKPTTKTSGEPDADTVVKQGEPHDTYSGDDADAMGTAAQAGGAGNSWDALSQHIAAEGVRSTVYVPRVSKQAISLYYPVVCRGVCQRIITAALY
jgi:hypothetical protein